MGTGRWYRQAALRRAGLKSGMAVLDVATGTGLVAESERAIVGPRGRVVGLDRSANMLREVRKKLPIPLVLADAGALPFATGNFDFLSMGYALRHVEDLRATFAEYLRVLKPGGTLLILELMRPRKPWMYRLVRAYFQWVVRLISAPVISGKESGHLIRYYWDTIDEFVDVNTLKTALEEVGFTQVRAHRTADFFTEITAVKP